MGGCLSILGLCLKSQKSMFEKSVFEKSKVNVTECCCSRMMTHIILLCTLKRDYGTLFSMRQSNNIFL